MNTNTPHQPAPSRLASSRLKNPKLWHATLPVTSVAATPKPTHHAPHKKSSETKSPFTLHLPLPALKALPFAGVFVALFLAFLFIIQPSQVQNTPFPDWYLPFHILSHLAVSSLLYLLTTKLKTSLTIASIFQTLFFLKLQHIELTPIVLLFTLILFGTIGFSAHLIQIFTSKHKRATHTPALHTLN